MPGYTPPPSPPTLPQKTTRAPIVFALAAMALLTAVGISASVVLSIRDVVRPAQAVDLLRDPGYIAQELGDEFEPSDEVHSIYISQTSAEAQVYDGERMLRRQYLDKGSTLNRGGAASRNDEWVKLSSVDVLLVPKIVRRAESTVDFDGYADRVDLEPTGRDAGEWKVRVVAPERSETVVFNLRGSQK